VALIERSAGWGMLFLPGALVVYLGFNAGGYFPGTPALVAMVLVLVLVAHVLVAERPFAGFSVPLGVCAGFLLLYALWALVSSSWSDSTWRALVEFDRGLLYLLALVVYGAIPRNASRVRWMARGVALGILVVCGAGLISRVLPNVWPIAPNLAENRLSYPITYWNALGILASIGTILCFHVTCSRSEPRALRVAGAGAVPLLATTVFFTLSRGAIVAGMIGLLAYLVLARPSALLGGLASVLPPTVAALVVSYNADPLTGPHPTSQAAVDQGHHVAAVLAICVLAAMLLRVAFLALDARIDRIWLPWRAWRPFFPSVAAVAIAVAVALALAVDAPGYVSHQYDRFVHGTRVPGTTKTRLTDPGNSGRLPLWKVALDDGFQPAEFHGEGAGTFETLWAADRPRKHPVSARDAHSLYVENLGDLGWVGFILVLGFVVTILYGFTARLGGPNRTLYGALFAAGLAWALHAGVDWDWEMPGVTLWLFAIGGAALAAPTRRVRVKYSPPLLARAGICVGLLLVAVIPARVTISQGKLNDAVQTFLRQGDCPAVIREADDAISVLGTRPDAYRLKGYCQARLGRTTQAVSSMQEAVDRDPRNWEFRYSLAVAEAAAGTDPRPAAREALRLDPLEPSVQDLVHRFRSSDPRGWRSQARFLLRAPLF
jgi:hypothetical protein